MGCVAVRHNTHVKALVHRRIDHIEKLSKLNRPMALVALTNNVSCLRVKSRKQRRCSISLVIVSLSFYLPGTHRQYRLGSIESLNLDLLSTQSTSVLSGVFMYSRTISLTFATSCGSFESWKCSDKWGNRPYARQMRPIAFLPTPHSFAVLRILR